MLTVPDFPVWVCLVCGYEDYDARAMDWLHYVFEKRDRQIYVDQDGNPRLKRHQHPFQNSFFTIN